MDADDGGVEPSVKSADDAAEEAVAEDAQHPPEDVDESVQVTPATPDDTAEAEDASWSWKQDDTWDKSTWKKDDNWPESSYEQKGTSADEPKDSIVDLNAKSSNNDLENGGIRVDDPFSFQYRLLTGPVGAASGAWLEAHDIPGRSGGSRPGKIFTLSETTSSADQRKRVNKYARLVLAAKRGWTIVDASSDGDGDMSVMSIPENARDSVIGSLGLLLAELSEQKSICAFAIDDGNSAPPVVDVKPPESWLEVGLKVEVQSQGDVRFVKWIVGTVTKIVSKSLVSVKPDRGGADIVVDWNKRARPNFADSEAVEAYVDVEAGEDDQSGGTSHWIPATFVAWVESGSIKVKTANEQEVELASDRVRRPVALKEAELAEEASPRPPIRLAIFGERRGRFDAVLAILAAAEGLMPSFFETNPPPLPPAIEYTAAAQDDDDDDETWFSMTVEITGNADSARKQMSRIQAACSSKAIIDIRGSTARIVGPREACSLSCALVKLAAAAERSEVTFDHAPVGVDACIEKVPMPGELVAFVSGKQRNRLNEIEDTEKVMCFFLRLPPPERKIDDNLSAHVSESVAEFLNKKQDDGEADTNAQEEDGETAKEDTADVPAEAAETQATEAEAWDSKASEKNDWTQEEKSSVEILIFASDARSRVRARLQLVRAVESKHAGFVLGPEPKACLCLENIVGTDVIELATEDMGWLSGKQGKNKRRIAAASGCGIEFFTNYAYLAGTGPERLRARQYLEWFLLRKPESQKGLEMTKEALAAREDVSVVMLTPDEKSTITKRLSDIEEETMTLLMFNHKPDAEFFQPGEKMIWNSGGRSFFIELQEAPAGEDMTFSCKLLSEIPWDHNEEEVSKVPLLIFGSNITQRGAAEQKIRDVFAPEEEDDGWAWDKQQDSSWETPSDSWNKKAEWDTPTDTWSQKAEWDTPTDTWSHKDERGDFKKGRGDRDSQGKWSHDNCSKEDAIQAWTGKASGGGGWNASADWGTSKEADKWDKWQGGVSKWSKEW